MNILDIKTTAALLNDRIRDYAEAHGKMKDSKYFIDWDEARQDMQAAIGEIDKLIDTLVINYNAMAKMCGVSNRKDIVRSIISPLDKTFTSEAV